MPQWEKSALLAGRLAHRLALPPEERESLERLLPLILVSVQLRTPYRSP